MHAQLRTFALLSLTALASSACEYASVEEVAAVESALIGVDSYMYLRCNSTSWGVDAKSHMLSTGVPGVVELSFDVTESWMVTTGDDCVLTETPEPDNWGSWQNYYTAAAAPVVAPATVKLEASPAGVVQNFRVKFPELGRFRVVVDTNSQTLHVGKPDQITPGQVTWTTAGQILLGADQNLYRIDTTRTALSKLDRATGAAVWTYSGAQLGFATGCALSDTIVASSGNDMIGVDVATGAKRWTSVGPEYGFYSPICHEGIDAVILTEAATPPVIRALRASNGSEQWSQPIPDGSWVRAVVAGAVVYSGQDAGEYVTRALNPATGASMWRYVGNDRLVADAAENLYRSTGTEVLRISPSTGKTAWKRAGTSLDVSEAGAVYIGNGLGRLDKVKVSDGKRVWSYDRPAASDPLLKVVSGSIVLTRTSDVSTSFTVLDPTSGGERWTHTTTATYAYMQADPLGRLLLLRDTAADHFDAVTGALKWTFAAPYVDGYGQSHVGSILDGDARGIYLTFIAYGYSNAPGGLGALDPATGAARWMSLEPYSLYYVGSDESRLFTQITGRGGYGDARVYLK